MTLSKPSRLRDITPQDIRRAALTLLARRDYSRGELTEKLLLKFRRRTRFDAAACGDAHSDAHSGGHGDGHGDRHDAGYACGDTGEEHSRQSLPDLIEQELTRLADENLQSDARFVESYINSSMGRGHGPDRIRAALRQRAVDASLVDRYLQAGDEIWCELARRVLSKKFGDTVPDTFREKSRRLRFLQQRGFAPWMVDGLLE